MMACLAGSSCFSKSGVEHKPLAVVYTKKAKLEIIADELLYPARIYSKVNAVILAENSGIVNQLWVSLGQSVKHQERLMQIQQTDPIYQYAPFYVVAPISGVVSAIEVTLGSHVKVGKPLATVVDPKQLEIQAEIPGGDLIMIQKGLKGEWLYSEGKSPSHYPSLPVQVLGVSPMVKPETGTATVKMIPLLSRQASLTPGMQGQVCFLVNQHEGILVPDYMVFYKDKESYVKKIENKTVRQVAVTLGKQEKGFIEILDGIKPEVELVERSSRTVADGELVEVQGSAPSN